MEKIPLNQQEFLHIPVMAEEVVHCFQNVEEPATFIDATFGRGGHTAALLKAFPNSSITAIDRDPQAIAHGETFLSSLPESQRHQLHLLQYRFSQLDSLETGQVSGILMDLGVSTPQLQEGHRGFSFRQDGPLDMRMSQTGQDAAFFLNTLSEKELATVFYLYGEERASRKVARHVVAYREQKPFTHTHQLSQLLENILPKGKIHPATKVFQALRIHVNEELEELAATLPIALSLLEPGGCLVVISFHSLEDRLVKACFQEVAKKDGFLVSKKPLTPSPEEYRKNPASRSAKLRFAQRKRRI